MISLPSEDGSYFVSKFDVNIVAKEQAGGVKEKLFCNYCRCDFLVS